MLNWRLALLVFALSLWTQPALAQQADTPEEQAAESSAEAAEPAGPINLTVTDTRKKRACSGLGPNGEILVCGRDDGSDVRVPDDELRTDDGLPRAPSVGMESCKGKGQKGCIGFGKVPPPVYIIDVKAIPLPPKGSDAEKVAKGEISDR